jgi:general secretion pathway protein D
VNPTKLPHWKSFVPVLAVLVGAGILYFVITYNSVVPVAAQNTAATNAPPPTTNAPVVATVATNAPVATNTPATPPATAAPPALAAPPPSAPDEVASDGTMQVSFQNANVDMIVQWLAKTTGKSVVKHPKVQCQLTIVSSKRIAQREAINLIYSALALEGFSTIESSSTILIVPDGQEPKLMPELVNNANPDLPEGRQRLIRIFQLERVQPNEVREKIKSVLSDKATIEVVDRANQLIITDYTDNIRLATELIKELDVTSESDVTIEFFPLKHAQAEEISVLIGQIINAQVTGSAASASNGGAPPRPGPMPPGSRPKPTPMPPPQAAAPPTAPSPSPGASADVKIWPDAASNRLIVAAPKAKMSEIRELLKILDVEKTQDVTVRVLPLENVSAEDLVREISPLYQRMAGKGAADRIEVTANSRSNSLIILSSEENFKALQRLVAALDREEAQEKVMRAFPLTNADAEDVAKQIRDLGQDQSSTQRYPFVYFSSSAAPRDSKKVNVVADRRRNTVVVQAPPSAVEEIAKLIEVLDAPINDSSLAPKIYRLKYVSATDIEDVLNELFLKRTQQQRTYWDPYMSMLDNANDQGSGGKLFGKVRITSEPYSNSIIITSNSPESLNAVEEVLKQLDSPSQAGESTMRITLNFARATTVASSVNILFAKGGSPPLRPANQQQQPQMDPRLQQPQNAFAQNTFVLEQETKEDVYYPWLGGQQENSFGRFGETGRGTTRPVSDLVGRVRVVADRRSNSLMITSNLHFFPQILKLISDLDAPTPQVLIEAKIIEVSSDFRDKLGVRWSPNGEAFTGEDLDDSVIIRSGAAYQKVFSGSLVANSLKSGVFESSVNLDVLIQFLRKNADAKVLAEPQLNIADNELGKLFVGAQVPFLSGSLNTDVGGRNDTFQYRDVGIILEVTPHINSTDEIALKIRTESSSIRSGETLFGGAILDTRNFRTDLMVKDGETIVLGGIIQREQSDIQRKVPGLGSIPGLGWAFRKKDRVAREVELMVFLRPRITRTPEQVRELLREVEEKMPLIRKWEEDRPVVPPPGSHGGKPG